MKKIASLLTGCLLYISISAQLSQSKIQKIDALIRSYERIKQFNGNVLVAQNGVPVFVKSYGMADFEWKIPNDPDTKFRIGSVTKQFTAMLIMQLKQQGKLDLDSNLITYLPWYRAETGKAITVRQMLTHTTGLKNYTDVPDFFSNLAHYTISTRQFAEKFCQTDLEFTPGSKFKYCNTDYYLLGVIVETLSGKPYAQALKEMIFDKTGMVNSGIDSISSILPKRAKGYVYGAEGYANADPINMATTIFSAGAIYSTVNDLLRWQKALRGTVLLSEENKKIFFTPGAGNYAFGNYVNKLKNGKTEIGHPGGILGFSSFMIRFVEDDIVIILLDNTTTHKRGSLDNTSLSIYSIICNEPYLLPKTPVSVVLTDTYLQNGVPAMISKYKAIRSDTSYDLSANNQFLNNFGYELFTKGKIKESLPVLQLAVQEFPTSANTLDSYAEVLLADRQYALSLEYYQKILTLEPGNKAAAAQIQQIKQLMQ